MADRPFAFVCSPLRGDAAANMERARGYCRQVYEAGYIPICPHIYFTQFLRDAVPEERAAGMEMGAALLKQCRALVVCGGEITEGMAAEIRLAERFRVPVLTLDVFLPDAARDRPPPPRMSVLKQIAAARAGRESGAKPAATERSKRREEER
jgi:hypothetical protein